MPYIPLKVYFRPPEIAKLALFRPKIATVAPFCQKPPNWRFSLKNHQISPEIIKFGNFPPKITTVALSHQKNPNRRLLNPFDIFWGNREDKGHWINPSKLLEIDLYLNHLLKSTLVASVQISVNDFNK